MTAAPPRPRAVVFDVGGVLVHVDAGVMAAVLGAAAGQPVSAEACAVSFQLAADDAYVLGVTDEDPRVRARWAERLGLPVTAVEAAFRALSEHDLDLWVRVDDEAHAALGAIRRAGVRLGVLSNANGDLDATLTRLGLRDAFEVVLDSGCAGMAKPDPRFFALAAAELGLPARDCWYVGDSLAEVEAALACGYGFAVAFTVAGTEASPGAAGVPVVDRLLDVSALVERAV